ncbi:hypothetical protein EC957_007647 [Mortierella hygrophila]|uniref:Uncharacterized protein n=1 Tax=Mortierella hygrophila TaxID=979708 RepID=A0A9P6JYG0_9FUNG|nr:hypothetical protein EC957_007647 [Mortierella hygrophila]
MTFSSSTEPTFVDDFLIAYLYERLVFEITLLHQNTTAKTTTTKRNNFIPMDLSSKFAYIAHYYLQLTLKDTSRQTGDTILHRLKLNSLSGVINYIVSFRHRYQVIPEHIANDIWLDDETIGGDQLPECISVPVFQLKDIVDMRRKFATIVPEPYRGEVEFLRVASSANRQCQEQELIHVIKGMTHSDVAVLSSSSKGISFSDYDLELLIKTDKPSNLPPEMERLDEIVKYLLPSLTQAGYETIEISRRYFEGKSATNPSSVCFLDPKSNLTCQVSFDHSAGTSIRKLFQAYASIDERVEPFVFIVQETLTRYGRTQETLSNLAVAMIAISYLQKERILPNLLKHQGRRVDFDFYSGPVEGRLPLEEEMVRGMDNRGVVAVTGGSKKKKRRGRSRSKKSKPSTSSSPTTQAARTPGTVQSEEDLVFKRLTEPTPGCRIACYDFDEEMAKIKSFDKSPTKKSPFRLVIDFFDYAAKKFKDWDDLLPPPAEPFAMMNGAKDRNEFFSGLIVQDPFVLDRNLATLTTGWRFKSISDVFQRISAALSNLSASAINGSEGADELGEVSVDEAAAEEHCRQSERNMDQLMSFLNVYDEYGDAVAGQSTEELAKVILLAYAYRLGPDEQ